MARLDTLRQCLRAIERGDLAGERELFHAGSVGLLASAASRAQMYSIRPPIKELPVYKRTPSGLRVMQEAVSKHQTTLVVTILLENVHERHVADAKRNATAVCTEACARSLRKLRTRR